VCDRDDHEMVVMDRVYDQVRVSPNLRATDLVLTVDPRPDRGRTREAFDPLGDSFDRLHESEPAPRIVGLVVFHCRA
jgi:hypothetical protein